MPKINLGDFTDPFNRVFIGDNLPALRALHKAKGECVDLVYLDPPFNSKRDYNFIGGISASSSSLQKAFSDTWNYKPEVFNAVVEDEHLGVAERDFLRGWKEAFGVVKGAGAELAYLCHMVPRLVAMKVVMKPTASIYLHCDQSANAALKKAMDVVFGAHNYRNDIVWGYGSPSNAKKWFPRKHDYLFFYAKSGKSVFNRNAIRIPHTRIDERTFGEGWNRDNPVPFTAELESELKKGRVPQSWWADFAPAYKHATEYMGYPTQKPLGLLRRIILASSNPGGVVLDPYCGCGTTIAACRQLMQEDSATGRKFIGMDMEGFAAQVMRRRMHDKHGGYELKLGYSRPTKLAEFDLLAHNKAWLYYEHYAVELIPGAMPATTETKTLLGLPTEGSGDKGMDGLLPMTVNGKDTCLVVSVKAGNGIPAHAVRDLNGVIANENNKSVVGGILVYRHGKPTASMLSEARGAKKIVGKGGKRYPGIRILSVKELWDARKTCKNDPKCWAERLELPVEMVESLTVDFSARAPQQQGFYSRQDA